MSFYRTLDSSGELDKKILIRDFVIVCSECRSERVELVDSWTDLKITCLACAQEETLYEDNYKG